MYKDSSGLFNGAAVFLLRVNFSKIKGRFADSLFSY